MTTSNIFFLVLGGFGGFVFGGLLIRLMEQFEEWVGGGALVRKKELEEAQRDEELWRELFQDLAFEIKKRKNECKNASCECKTHHIPDNVLSDD